MLSSALCGPKKGASCSLALLARTDCGVPLADREHLTSSSKHVLSLKVKLVKYFPIKLLLRLYVLGRPKPGIFILFIQLTYLPNISRQFTTLARRFYAPFLGASFAAA